MTSAADLALSGPDDTSLTREREISRGVARLLWSHGLVSIAQMTLPDGRRADVAGLAPDGTIWIVEVKSSIEDFRGDQKWPEYCNFCDQFYFAVAPEFPVSILPGNVGLILADRFGGELVRAAIPGRIASARRKVMTLRLARHAALRLQARNDPGFDLDRAAAWRETG